MRIFYFARIDVSDENANTRHVFEICRQFAKLGNAVTLFVPDLGHVRPLDGVTLVYVPVIIRKPAVTYFSFHIVLFFFFLFYYFKLKPDAVYTRHQQLEWLVTWLKKVLPFTYVVEVNGLAEIELKMNARPKWVISLTRCLEKILFRLPDKVITPTFGIRDYLCKNYGMDDSRVLVINNGANPEISRPLDKDLCRDRLNLKKQGKYLIFVGGFKKWHGLPQMIQIMPELIRRIPEIELLVVGEGEEKNFIQEQIKNAGLDGKVILFGKKPFVEIPYYINAADICLAPYFDERLWVCGLSPLKIFEYMSCGQPIITTRVKGLDVLFDTWHVGKLVDSLAPSEWVGVIADMFNDPEAMRKYGENGRQAVLREFNWELIGKKTADMIQNLHRSK